MTFDLQSLKQGISPEQANDLFQEAEAASPEFMIGRWKGSEVPTGHPMDGLLTVAPWYGKFFLNEETVHPLVFSDRAGRRYSVSPRKAFAMIQSPSLLRAAKKLVKSIQSSSKPFDPHNFDALFYAINTKKSGARLRRIRFHGADTAAMVYDDLAIIDVFKKLDDNTVLGQMDIKGLEQDWNYFFLLERDNRKGAL